MRIAIIGTRGIPNYYGGFEQFAEYLSLGLVKKGHSVTVYNSHTHPYQEQSWNGVDLVYCKDPEDKYGTAGQFIYDFNCILDVRKKSFDIILQLGYTSSSVWGWMLPNDAVITTNMDGLEWKRTKYSKSVQKFLLLAERLGVKYSDHLISDSVGIQEYLKKKYNKDSEFIPYGAHLFKNPDQGCLEPYHLEPYGYHMLIARLEPENSIEMILDGFCASKSTDPFLVVGKHETKFGEYLKDKFSGQPNIRFVGGIYDIGVLNSLRHFSNLYFHGHTVGGTNPSLLEAMASQSLICAHGNVFNESILGADAFYFKNAAQVKSLIKKRKKVEHLGMIRNNEDKIETTYSWPIIVDQYLRHFYAITSQKEAQLMYQS